MRFAANTSIALCYEVLIAIKRASLINKTRIYIVSLTKHTYWWFWSPKSNHHLNQTSILFIENGNALPNSLNYEHE